MSRLWKAVFLSLIWLSVAIACEGQATPSVRVENWDLVERTRIGSLDDPEMALTRVTGGVLGNEGEILLLQPMDAEIRVYSVSRALLRTIGGRGGGPGKFSSPVRMGWVAGNLYIVDRATGRVAIYSPDGELVTDWRPSIVAPPGQRLTPMPEALLSHGLILVNGRRSIGSGDGGQVPELFWTVDSTGAGRGPQLELSRRNSRIAIRNPEAPTLGYFDAQPFPDNPLMAVDPRGRFLIVVERSVEAFDRPVTPARILVHRVDPAGDTAWSRTLQVQTTPLDAGIRDSAVAAIWERLEVARGPAMDTRRKRAALADQLYLPAVLPPIDQVVVDYHGNSWIRRSSGASDQAGPQAEWLVVDAGGNLAARARGPRGMTILDHREDTVIGVVKDELDVDYVVVSTVERSAT